MTTELTRRAIATPTPQHDKSLSPQALEDHRQKIAFDVKVVLSAYFQPHEAEEIKAAQLAWWCDELQEWTQEQVVWALRHWNRENPRFRPTPGDIVAICKRARGEQMAKQTAGMRREQAPPRTPATREEAARILEKVGFAPKRTPDNETDHC